MNPIFPTRFTNQTAVQVGVLCERFSLPLPFPSGPTSDNTTWIPEGPQIQAEPMPPIPMVAAMWPSFRACPQHQWALAHLAPVTASLSPSPYCSLSTRRFAQLSTAVMLGASCRLSVTPMSSCADSRENVAM